MVVNSASPHFENTATMVPYLIVLLKVEANLVEPHDFICKVLAKSMQKLTTIGPSSILALRRHYRFLCKLKRSLRYFLLFKYCSEVVHHFNVFLRILYWCNWSRSTLVLFERLYVLPKVTTHLKRHKLVPLFSLLFLFSLHYLIKISLFTNYLFNFD